jgi:hypothetical protein
MDSNNILFLDVLVYRKPLFWNEDGGGDCSSDGISISSK